MSGSALPMRSVVGAVALALSCLTEACSGEAFSQANADAGTGGDESGGAPVTGGRGSGGRNAAGGSRSTGGLSAAGGARTGGTTGSGGAGTGGFVAAGGVVGSGGRGTGGVNATCPPNVPNGSCVAEGLQCTYGDCCPTFAECHDGQWQVSAAPCVAPTCPLTPPVHGAPCGCLDAPDCDFDRCQEGGTHVHSLCVAGAWEVQDLPCPIQDLCIGFGCASNTYCMQQPGTGSAMVVSCVPWICTDPTAPPCLCIGAACTGLGGACTPLASGTGVFCTAPSP